MLQGRFQGKSKAEIVFEALKSNAKLLKNVHLVEPFLSLKGDQINYQQLEESQCSIIVKILTRILSSLFEERENLSAEELESL